MSSIRLAGLTRFGWLLVTLWLLMFAVGLSYMSVAYHRRCLEGDPCLYALDPVMLAAYILAAVTILPTVLPWPRAWRTE